MLFFEYSARKLRSLREFIRVHRCVQPFFFMLYQFHNGYIFCPSLEKFLGTWKILRRILFSIRSIQCHRYACTHQVGDDVLPGWSLLSFFFVFFHTWSSWFLFFIMSWGTLSIALFNHSEGLFPAVWEEDVVPVCRPGDEKRVVLSWI